MTWKPSGLLEQRCFIYILDIGLFLHSLNLCCQTSREKWLKRILFQDYLQKKKKKEAWTD